VDVDVYVDLDLVVVAVALLDVLARAFVQAHDYDSDYV